MNQDLLLDVAVDDQCLKVSQTGRLLASYQVSTAVKGVGFTNGSMRTPTGRFRVLEKIGDGEPAGTIFRERVPSGVWHVGDATDEDLILTRILRLEGMDPENSNTMERCIYIHGTNREDLLGSPASHGCIRLGNKDMLALYAQVQEGTELLIQPPVRRRGKLIFLDCDSTLSGIEGIDELARTRGAEVYDKVVALTNAAMNGEVPLDEVFTRRMNIIRPDKAACDIVASRYVETITPGALELISELKQSGWLPVILSGGFAPLIAPLASKLGIVHVEAVPLYFAADGEYAGYGDTYPTTRNGGKNAVIREWQQALLPERVAMMGDGVSDLETQPDVDVFIGFGGVVVRQNVRDKAAYWIDNMTEVKAIMHILDGKA
jgi:phosphoserine phosphatase